MGKLKCLMFLFMLVFRSDGVVFQDIGEVTYQGNRSERVSDCLIYGKGVRLGCSELRHFLRSDTLSPWNKKAGLNSLAIGHDNSVNFHDLTGYMPNREERERRLSPGARNLLRGGTRDDQPQESTQLQVEEAPRRASFFSRIINLDERGARRNQSQGNDHLRWGEVGWQVRLQQLQQEQAELQQKRAELQQGQAELRQEQAELQQDKNSFYITVQSVQAQEEHMVHLEQERYMVHLETVQTAQRFAVGLVGAIVGSFLTAGMEGAKGAVVGGAMGVGGFIAVRYGLVYMAALRGLFPELRVDWKIVAIASLGIVALGSWVYLISM